MNMYTKALVMFRNGRKTGKFTSNTVSGALFDDLMAKFKRGDDLGDYEAWIAKIGPVTREQIRW